MRFKGDGENKGLPTELLKIFALMWLWGLVCGIGIGAFFF
jgi:hypothetical protein